MMKKLLARIEGHLQKRNDPYAIRPEKWCCTWFKDMFEKRYQEGIFIYATPPTRQYGGAQFWIGMRAIPQQEFKNLSTIRFDSRIRMVLATNVHVTHCPSCGRHLTRFYLRHLAQVIDQDFIREFMQDSQVNEKEKKNTKEPNQAL